MKFNKFFWILSLMFLLLLSVASATVYWNDSFDRADSSTVGNGWVETETTNVVLEISSNNLKMSDDNSGNGWIIYRDGLSESVTQDNLSVDFRIKVDPSSSQRRFYWTLKDSDDDIGFVINFDYSNTNKWTIYDYSTTSHTDLSTSDDGGYHVFSFRNWDVVNHEYDLYVDDVLEVSNVGYNSLFSDTIENFYSASYSANTQDTVVWLDYINISDGVNPNISTNFSVSAFDFWVDSDVNNITVTIDGTTYTNTSGNTVTTNILTNDTSLYDISITGQDYFSRTYEDINVSSNLNAKLYQSQINFSVSEYITNNTITGGNCTVNTTNQLCSLPFYISEGTYNVTFHHDDYINKTVEFNVSPLDNKTVAITDVFGVLINVTPLDVFDNSSLSNFTGWLYDNNNDNNMTFSTTDSFYVLPGVVNGSYLLSVSPSGYATNNVIFTANETYYNVSTYHYLFNSFFVTFRDEVTNDIVNNVTLDLISELYSNNYTTTNGTMYISALTPEGYTLRYTGDNYTTRFYYLDIVDDSFFDLTLYLKEEDTAVSTTIIVYDTASSSNLAGAVVKVQRYDITTNTYKVVQMGLTDTDGEVIFDIVQDSEFYKFVVEYNDEVVKITEPQPIEKTTIKIPVTIGDKFLEDYRLFKYIVHDLTFNGVTNNFRFTFNDPSGIEREYCLKIYKLEYDSKNLINSTCLDTSSGTILLPVNPINGSSYQALSTVVISGDLISLGDETVTFRSITFGDNGMLLQLFLTIIFISSGFIAVEAIPISVPLSIIAGGLFYFHTIPLYYTVPLLVLGIILSFRVSK